MTIAEGKHPFPCRTRKLSPLAPMVLLARVSGRVGRCREIGIGPFSLRGRALFVYRDISLTALRRRASSFEISRFHLDRFCNFIYFSSSWAHSSVGESAGLTYRRSLVQVQLGPPMNSRGYVICVTPLFCLVLVVVLV